MQDMQSYIMEFDDNDHMELTVNLISKSMYAQCDLDGNQYLLLAVIVDHRSITNAIRLANQKGCLCCWPYLPTTFNCWLATLLPVDRRINLEGKPCQPEEFAPC